MSNALAKIYALQQRELNEKERQKQQRIAKHQRLIAAFSASGFLDIFNEFRNVPLRSEVRQRVYKQTVGELTYHAGTAANPLHSMSFMPITGMSSGPRWWCEETDTGKIIYGYTSGRTTGVEFFDSPGGLWLDSFIEYLAAAADAGVITNMIQTSTPAAALSTRRQLQPI